MRVIVDAFGGDNAPKAPIAGAVEAGLYDDRLYVELIADGKTDDDILIELSLPETARMHIKFIRIKLVSASTTIPETGVHS